MKIRTLLAAALTMAAAATVQAAPITYTGTLVSGTPANGTVGGFSYFLDDATGINFWSFNAVAGNWITLEVDRLNGNLDPALSLYRGTTTADTSTFDSASSFGGMTFLGSLDDEHPPFVGPANFTGDPYGMFYIATTGAYTVAVGGSDSTDGGSYPYRISLTVPEPDTCLLIGFGVIGLALSRRRPGAARRRSSVAPGSEGMAFAA